MYSTKPNYLLNQAFFPTTNSVSSAILPVSITCNESMTTTKYREVQYPQYLSVSEIADLFKRKANRAYIKFSQSEAGQEILAQARKYGIPYSNEYIDFFDLASKIEDFESLIKEADEMYIDWQDFGYDPIGIEQAIEDLSEQNFKNQMVERVYGSSLAYYG